MPLQPRFLTKEQRAQLAIEKRSQEIKEQKDKEDRAKKEREALEREAEEVRAKERERERTAHEQRDQAHLLSGGGLPPEVDRPLLQFACETLHEYTLSETQRVELRDGFHTGIRVLLVGPPRR